MGQLAQPASDPSDYVLAAKSIVARTEHMLGIEELCPPITGSDIQALDDALSAARHALGQRLDVTTIASPFQAQNSIAALMLQAEQTQITVKDVLLTVQGEQVASAQSAINALRGATSVAALIERIPTEVYRMGFSRVLFSRVRSGVWLTCSAFAGSDEDMALKMVEAGLANPRQLVGPLWEADMIRRGSPILVLSPQDDPRVHPELLATTRSVGYVAAPVFSWGKAIGLVHADRHADTSQVTEFDRDVLGIFAAGLGLAFERNVMIDRLAAMRRAAAEHMRIAGSLADDFTVDVLGLAGTSGAPADDIGVNHAAAPAALGEASTLSQLTSREAEVLRAIAVGKTNAQIASTLYVTEGTVKSHVKHILRKLGAANRTEAVAKYHQARHTSMSSSRG